MQLFCVVKVVNVTRSLTPRYLPLIFQCCWSISQNFQFHYRSRVMAAFVFPYITLGKPFNSNVCHPCITWAPHPLPHPLPPHPNPNTLTAHENQPTCVYYSCYFSLQLIPAELQEKWQRDLEAIDAKLGGTAEKPISSLLIMLETPEEMIVLCTAGKHDVLTVQS